MKNFFRGLCFLLCAAILLSGCKREGQPQTSPATAANTLKVLAGSELKDIEPLLPQIEQATGIHLEMRYAGTLDAVERLQAGEAFDLAWLASNHYAMLTPGVKNRVAASERTMLTPVVLGIKQSKAHELGWENNPNLSWKDIADAATKGKFTFGMTSPSASNTGFSGLLGLAAALSGKGDALEVADINTAALAAFFKAQRMTAGSSGWLVDAFMKDQGKVDALINYASTLQSLNRNPQLQDKFVLIYPKDGIVTADYPLMLLDPAKRDAYTKLVTYLRGPVFQKSMAETTLRKPVNPDVQVAGTESPATIELSFPAKLEVIDAILAAFDDELRLPTDATFVLDQSGSMGGERIDGLKTAMLGLTGADTSISGRFAKFHKRERISILPFSDNPGRTQHFDMGNDVANNTAMLGRIKANVESLQADGSTAIFDSLVQAYTEALTRRHTDPGRFYSIVLMTDGENNRGRDWNDFKDWYDRLAAEDKNVRIFCVVFGEADPKELQRISDLTGGRTFDGRKSNLRAVFKEIRGYQ